MANLNSFIERKQNLEGLSQGFHAKAEPLRFIVKPKTSHAQNIKSYLFSDTDT